MGSGEVRRRESYLRALSDNLAVLSKALAIAAVRWAPSRQAGSAGESISL